MKNKILCEFLEPLAFASALELNETCEHLYTKILEEVLQSTNRQPSVSGVVLDVMTDIIKGTEVEESKPAKGSTAWLVLNFEFNQFSPQSDFF